MEQQTEYVQTVVVGGGQAGLAAGYHLARRGLPFVILNASERAGDTWRKRWDSLRLFTPARFNGLPGMPFPAPKFTFPTKNEMGDYLDAYAERFKLPVRNAVQVEHLSRRGDRYVLRAGGSTLEAEHVVVAMSRYQRPAIPAFAGKLASAITQLHADDYRNASQLRGGRVLVAGAGNSGADIALDLARTHQTWLSGRDTGHIPFRIESFAARHLIQPVVLGLVFHRLLTVGTPMGRKARVEMLSKGGPLIRVKPADLAAAGVTRVPRVAGAKDGLPMLEDGRTLEVENVIWCTGFRNGFSFIELPVFGEYGMPEHDRGVARGEPGLYFLGLPFIYSLSSAMIHGLDRDAKRIVHTVEQRVRDAGAYPKKSLEAA